MAGSTLFEKHFATKDASSRIILFGISYQDASDLLKFMYTGSLTVADESRISILSKISKTLGYKIPIPEIDQQTPILEEPEKKIKPNEKPPAVYNLEKMQQPQSKKSISNKAVAQTQTDLNKPALPAKVDGITAQTQTRLNKPSLPAKVNGITVQTQTDLYEPNGVPSLLHALRLTHNFNPQKKANDDHLAFETVSSESIQVIARDKFANAFKKKGNNKKKRSLTIDYDYDFQPMEKKPKIISNNSCGRARNLRPSRNFKYNDGDLMEENFVENERRCCQYCFNPYVNVPRHERTCGLNPRFDNVCPVCEVTFTRKENIKRHLIGVHKYGFEQLEKFDINQAKKMDEAKKFDPQPAKKFDQQPVKQLDQQSVQFLDQQPVQQFDQQPVKQFEFEPLIN